MSALPHITLTANAKVLYRRTPILRPDRAAVEEALNSITGNGTTAVKVSDDFDVDLSSWPPAADVPENAEAVKITWTDLVATLPQTRTRRKFANHQAFLAWAQQQYGLTGFTYSTPASTEEKITVPAELEPQQAEATPEPAPSAAETPELPSVDPSPQLQQQPSIAPESEQPMEPAPAKTITKPAKATPPASTAEEKASGQDDLPEAWTNPKPTITTKPQTVQQPTPAPEAAAEVTPEPSRTESGPRFQLPRRISEHPAAPSAEAPVPFQERPLPRRISEESIPRFLAAQAAVPLDLAPAASTPPQPWYRRLFPAKAADPQQVEQQRQERLALIESIARGFNGNRTISVLNTKGGSGKTPSVVMLAATFAQHGGAGVLAWDNNETDGNLSERTDPGRHHATTVDLAERAGLMDASQASYGDLAQYVHRQPHDKFDALWSQLDGGSRRVMRAEDVATMHALFARFYQLLVIDSGNNDLAPNATAAFERTDQLIVPVTEADDKASRGWRNLDRFAARGGHYAKLAREAVVVVNTTEPGKEDLAAEVAAAFSARGNRVFIVPFDPTLVRGPILLRNTAAATQDAWLRIASSVASTF